MKQMKENELIRRNKISEQGLFLKINKKVVIPLHKHIANKLTQELICRIGFL